MTKVLNETLFTISELHRHGLASLAYKMKACEKLFGELFAQRYTNGNFGIAGLHLRFLSRGGGRAKATIAESRGEGGGDYSNISTVFH